MISDTLFLDCTLMETMSKLQSYIGEHEKDDTKHQQNYKFYPNSQYSLRQSFVSCYYY